DYPKALSNELSIPPLLLIVFVENAFKHGISNSHPSFIHMKIETTEQSVSFTIANSKRPLRSGHQPGIGLKNVKKRLELIYGTTYTLDIEDTNPDTYTVKLIIPLHHA
ncbi:MAG: regulator, partial [Muribaculaceae bacterium]